jgi:seryl-tRNA synthetase
MLFRSEWNGRMEEVMIDIKFLRENPEVVKENIRKKFQDEKLSLVDEVIALDAESRKAKQEADDLRASRNRISKEIGALMGQGKKEEASFNLRGKPDPSSLS